jgi:hypothetical protein
MEGASLAGAPISSRLPSRSSGSPASISGRARACTPLSAFWWAAAAGGDPSGPHGGGRAAAFPPSSLRPTPGPPGRGETGRDAEGRLKLSTCRLRTSRPMVGVMWGREGTGEATARRPVKSPALPTQVRILSCHIGPDQQQCGPGPPNQVGFGGRVSLRFPPARRPADTARPSRAAGPKTPRGAVALGRPGRVEALPFARRQIAMTSSSNATVTRRVAGSWTASS